MKRILIITLSCILITSFQIRAEAYNRAWVYLSFNDDSNLILNGTDNSITSTVEREFERQIKSQLMNSSFFNFTSFEMSVGDYFEINIQAMTAKPYLTTEFGLIYFIVIKEVHNMPRLNQPDASFVKSFSGFSNISNIENAAQNITALSKIFITEYKNR